MDTIPEAFGLVTQLVRVPPSQGGSRGFESLQAHQQVIPSQGVSHLKPSPRQLGGGFLLS